MQHRPPLNIQSVRDFLARAYWFVRGREPMVLVGLLVVVGGAWSFIELADNVFEGDTGDFDRWAIESLRRPEDHAVPIGPGWLAEVGRDITGLGGVAVLTLFIVAATGFLAINRAYRTMVFLLVATSSGMILSSLMKNVFARPRPDFVPHLSQVYTSSFPSGHSMMSAVVYLTLGVLLTPVLRSFWSRAYVLGIAIVLTVLVGLSRVYMGVHYPTDVLAGWTAGLVWSISCWLLLRRVLKSKPQQ